MAGITMSPQLRASAETRNVHEAAARPFCWARASQPEDPMPAASTTANHARRRMRAILLRLSRYPGAQRGELRADNPHLKRVRRVRVEHIEVPIAHAQLPQDVVRDPRGLPETLLVDLHRFRLVARER